MTGFAIGFILGLAYGLDYGMASVMGLAPGLALASYAWWSIPTNAAKVSTPTTVLRRERIATASYGPVLGAAFGVVVGLIYGFAANVTLGTAQAILEAVIK
jgi:hypothetical protein